MGSPYPAPMIVYCYDKCQTCRKALKYLDARGVNYQKRDIVSQPPKVSELKRALAGGLPLKKLFNTSGGSYRDGKWGQRLTATTEADALAALAADGKLVKRPFIVGGDFVLVGFDEDAYAARF